MNLNLTTTTPSSPPYDSISVSSDVIEELWPLNDAVTHVYTPWINIAVIIVALLAIVVISLTYRGYYHKRLKKRQSSQIFSTNDKFLLFEEEHGNPNELDPTDDMDEADVLRINLEFLQHSPISSSLRDFILQNLERGERIYWADTPLFPLKHKRTLRNGIAFAIASIGMSVVFSIVSGIVVIRDNSLITSIMGGIGGLAPLLGTVYYTVSLVDLNVAYAITSHKVLFARKKGFFRWKFRSEKYGFDRIQQVEMRNVDPESGCGDLYFLRDEKVASNVVFHDWKLDTNSTTTLIGFRSIPQAELAEVILMKQVAKRNKKAKVIKSNRDNEGFVVIDRFHV
eukprot:gb/GECH01000975.1/.p1 GENE.gb/GECH01000975.1/~~gb/GECH01000975.1/.p1  ORF type:complete len:340 (+),score=77.95 gb/GECH01000975.1/:1-1020(+)